MIYITCSLLQVIHISGQIFSITNGCSSNEPVTLRKVVLWKHYLQKVINLLPFHVPTAYEQLEQIALL